MRMHSHTHAKYICAARSTLHWLAHWRLLCSEKVGSVDAVRCAERNLVSLQDVQNSNDNSALKYVNIRALSIEHAKRSAQ